MQCAGGEQVTFWAVGQQACKTATGATKKRCLVRALPLPFWAVGWQAHKPATGGLEARNTNGKLTTRLDWRSRPQKLIWSRNTRIGDVKSADLAPLPSAGKRAKLQREAQNEARNTRTRHAAQKVLNWCSRASFGLSRCRFGLSAGRREPPKSADLVLQCCVGPSAGKHAKLQREAVLWSLVRAFWAVGRRAKLQREAQNEARNTQIRHGSRPKSADLVLRSSQPPGAFLLRKRVATVQAVAFQIGQLYRQVKAPGSALKKKWNRGSWARPPHPLIAKQSLGRRTPASAFVIYVFGECQFFLDHCYCDKTWSEQLPSLYM